MVKEQIPSAARRRSKDKEQGGSKDDKAGLRTKGRPRNARGHFIKRRDAVAGDPALLIAQPQTAPAEERQAEPTERENHDASLSSNAAAGPAIEAGEASRVSAAKKSRAVSRKTLVSRVAKSIEQELLAVDALMRDHGASGRDEEAERRARTLASLARTLRELMQIQQADRKSKPDDDDSFPRDVNELRRELARRLDALVADATAICPDESGAALDGSSD